MTTCRLSALVGPAFAPAHRALKNGEAGQLVLKGGRGSGKSSFAAIEGILLLLRHPGMHGLVLRKVGLTLRNSVFAQYRWAVAVLGLSGRFKATSSPMELTYLPTGQKLLFFGGDDPGKLKSLKPAFGYIGLLHFEELDQFEGEEEIRSIEQSVLRGGQRFYEIKVFNPPRSREHWANRYCETARAGQLIHHSTYLQLPPAWLGPRFMQDAAFLQEQSPDAYEHEYLGVANGVGGAVFQNLQRRCVTRAERQALPRLAGGVDWGWYPDAFAFNLVAYDAARRTLYILEEVTAQRKGNRETAALVQCLAGPEITVVCDSAEPKSVADYRAFGIKAQAAMKGRGSVEYSYKWLQGLAAIVIDTEHCPHTWTEFYHCAYGRNRDGTIGDIPDRNNHHIDAVRYATEKIWRRRGR